MHAFKENQSNIYHNARETKMSVWLLFVQQFLQILESEQ